MDGMGAEVTMSAGNIAVLVVALVAAGAVVGFMSGLF